MATASTTLPTACRRFMASTEKPKDKKDSILDRRKGAVLRILDQLIEDGKDLSCHLQDPRSPRPPPDQRAVWRLLELLEEFGPLVHHRLYFSPTLQYFYALQVARRRATTTRSGESIEMVENKVTLAQRQREAELATREHLVESLTAHLNNLRTSGATAVNICRQDARVEIDEARGSSEMSLQKLKGDLQASLQAMAKQEARHEQAELELRERRQELEMEIKGVICRYDGTMSKLQTRLDDLKTNHAQLMDSLNHKKEWLHEVEEQYRSIQAEKQRLEEERMAAMQAEFRREYAARTIQRAWQHYKMRKMLKKAQRKRKKKPKDVKETKK